jgi:hypothetical protein
MARKTLDEQAKEIEIKLMQLELACARARDTAGVERARETLETLETLRKSC